MLRPERIRIFFCIWVLLDLLALNCFGVFGASENATLHTSGTETVTVGTWDLPWPFADYRIEFYAIPSFEGSNTVSWDVDKDLISPGESVSLAIDLHEGEHHYRMDFRIVVRDKSADAVILDRTAGVDLGTMSIPGSWSSPKTAVPIIPFEIVGIPVELSIYFHFSLSTTYSLSFDTYGLQPQTTKSDFPADMTKYIDFSKSSGVGADITLSSAQVEAEGGLVVSAGLSLAGIPTPLNIDFASVPIVGWITHHNQGITMATLRTPITLEVSVNPTSVTLGEQVEVSGQVTPAAGGLTIQIIASNTTIGTAVTAGDGSYMFNWKPTHIGTITLFSKCAATKYTTSATSSTISIPVKEASNPLTDFVYRYPWVIVVIAGVVAIAAVVFWTMKRHVPHPRG